MSMDEWCIVSYSYAIVLENWDVRPITPVLSWFSRSHFLSFLTPGPTIFPESKNPLSWYRHYLTVVSMLSCYHHARFFNKDSLERACVRGAKASKRGFIGVLIMKKLWSLSPWPMCYRCKWSVQPFLLVYFTSKCLCNEVIGSSKRWYLVSTPRRIKRRITFRPWDSSFRLRLVSKLIPIQGTSSMKHVVFKIGRHFLSGFPWSNSALVQSLSMVFYPLTAALQRFKCLRHNIDDPWFVVA